MHKQVNEVFALQSIFNRLFTQSIHSQKDKNERKLKKVFMLQEENSMNLYYQRDNVGVNQSRNGSVTFSRNGSVNFTGGLNKYASANKDMAVVEEEDESQHRGSQEFIDPREIIFNQKLAEELTPIGA